MEYIPTTLSPRGLDKSRAVLYLTHISSALVALHADNMVHQDVKPANILIKDDQVAKLADFGTARRLIGGILEPEFHLATPIYSAPECYEVPRRYTDKVDMFALGLVALQCLSLWDPKLDDTWSSRIPVTSQQHQYWMSSTITPLISSLRVSKDDCGHDSRDAVPHC